MKEFKIEVGSSYEDRAIEDEDSYEDEGYLHYHEYQEAVNTFYESTYKKAIEAAIELLTLNDEILIAEIYSREECYSPLMVLRWDSESKKVCPMYGETSVKEIGMTDRQAIIDYCLKMKGKEPKKYWLGYSFRR